MIAPLLIGIIALFYSVKLLKTYFLFASGLKIKGTVLDANQKQAGVRRVSTGAEIIYKYEINGKIFTNTEFSEEKRHLFKTSSMIGEPISILVQKKLNDKATIKSISPYLKYGLPLLIIGLITFSIGIVNLYAKLFS